MKRDSECPHGDSCIFAHSVFEIWLHPARYRTQLCSYGVDCKRGICFFAHYPGELRVHENTAELLALEKELEGSDNTPSSAGMSGQMGSTSNIGNRFGGGSSSKSSQRQGQKNALGGSGGSLRGSPLPVSQSLPLHEDALLQAVQWSNLMTQSSPSQQQQQQALMNATLVADQAQLQAAVLAMTQSMNTNLMRSSPLAAQAQAVPSSSALASSLNTILAHSPKAPRASASPLTSSHMQEAKNNDVKQALELVSQLKDLVGRAHGSEVGSVLLALLPDILSQVHAQVTSNQHAQQMSPPHHISAPSQSMNHGAWSSQGMSNSSPSFKRMSHGSPSFNHIDASRFSPIQQPSFMQVQDDSTSSEGIRQPFGSHPSPGIFANVSHQQQRSPADVLSLKSKRSEQTSCSSRSQSPTQSENNSDEVHFKKQSYLPTSAVELDSPFCTPMLHPDLQRAAAEQERGQSSSAKRNDDAKLAAAMSEMSGASAMIASLSLLVDPFDSLPS